MWRGARRGRARAWRRHHYDLKLNQFVSRMPLNKNKTCLFEWCRKIETILKGIVIFGRDCEDTLSFSRYIIHSYSISFFACLQKHAFGIDLISIDYIEMLIVHTWGCINVYPWKRIGIWSRLSPAKGPIKQLMCFSAKILHLLTLHNSREEHIHCFMGPFSADNFNCWNILYS